VPLVLPEYLEERDIQREFAQAALHGTIRPASVQKKCCITGRGRNAAASTETDIGSVEMGSWSGTGGPWLVSITFNSSLAQAVSFYSPKGNIMMRDRGEAFVSRVSSMLCSSCRRAHDYFLDIGSNDGHYSMLAAAHGCQVRAFDTIPKCGRLFQKVQLRNMKWDANVLANKGTSRWDLGRVTWMNRPITNDTLPLNVPWNKECDGRNQARGLPGNARTQVVRPITGAELLTLIEPSPNIIMVKIDV